MPLKEKLLDGRIRGLTDSIGSGLPVTIGPGLMVGKRVGRVGLVKRVGLKVGLRVGLVGLGNGVGLRVGRCESGSAALLDLLKGGRVGLYPGRVGLYPGGLY